MKRTHEEFVNEVSVKNPRVEIVGSFEGVSKKIQVRCKEFYRVSAIIVIRTDNKLITK